MSDDGTELKVVSVTKKFSGIVALKDVSLELKKGEILGLIGPNGAGKTTLFNIIAGYIKPTSGSVYFREKEITSLPPHKICKLGIARTFQIPKPFLDMTVIDNIRVALEFNSREKKINAYELSKAVGLDKKAEQKASNLNVSNKKRLEVARAIATGPSILLLDEIAAGLSVQESEWAIDFIRSLPEKFGVSVIWVEHVMRVLMKGVDRVVVLNQGSKIAEGKPEEIAQNEEVKQAYLGRTRV